MKLTYPGPHDEIEIPSLGISVARGASAEIEDPAVAAQLQAQGWTKAGRTAKEDADG